MKNDPKPKRAKPRDIEGPIHRSILQWLRVQFPRAVIHHSPNETKWRSEKAMHVVAKAKSLGTLPGFPDLVMLHEGGFYALEVKNPRGQLSDAQRAVGEAIQSAGGRWALVRSIDDAKIACSRWGLLR